MWPFIGRAEAVVRVGRALDVGGNVVLAGPAGVGKSRLAEQVARTRIGVARARASESARGLPLGAFAGLVAGQPRPDALGWALDQVLAARPQLVLVDDAHLLDAASAALVHQLATRVQLLVTVRSGEPCSDAVTALWKDELAERIGLEPLDRAETVALVRAVMDAPVEAQALDRLRKLSQGNLLYLRELVAGNLAKADDRWRWKDDHPLGTRLTELVSARIGELDAQQRAALEYVAFGEPLDLGTLVALTSSRALEELDDRGLIAIDDAVRLMHPLYGEVVRADCPRLRTVRRYRELAAAVEARGGSDQLRVAAWRMEGGDSADSGLLLDACRLAWAAHDYPLARRFGQAALNAGGGIEAALMLATLHNYADEAELAEAVLESVWELECDERTRTLLTLTRAHALAWGGLGRQADADRLLAGVEPTLLERENRQEIMILRGVMAVARDDYRLSSQVAADVIDDPSSTPLWAQAMLVRAWTEVCTGRCHDGVATARTALDRRDEWLRAVPPIVGSLNSVIIDAYRFTGDLDALDAAIEQSHKTTVEGAEWDRAVYHDRMARGIAARLRGKIDDALAEMQAAPRIEGFATVSAAELALTAAQSGRARPELLVGVRESIAAGGQIFAFTPDLAEHWVLAAAGEIRRAAETAISSAVQLRDRGAVAAEAIVLHDAVRLGAGHRVASRLAELTQLCQGTLFPLFAEHAAAASDGARLDSVSVQFARLGLLLHAAEAAAQAALAHQASGRTASARASTARAWNLAARCPGARTPALARLRSPGLTTRELEIATLAAAGGTNRQIAEQLTLSVRTIDNHLHAAYAKLGVSSRTELAQVLF